MSFFSLRYAFHCRRGKYESWERFRTGPFFGRGIFESNLASLRVNARFGDLIFVFLKVFLCSGKGEGTVCPTTWEYTVNASFRSGVHGGFTTELKL